MYNKFPVFKNKNVRKIYNSYPELQNRFTAGEKVEINIATMNLEQGLDAYTISQKNGVKIQIVARIINTATETFKDYEKGKSLRTIAEFYEISERLAFYYILMGIQNKINTMLGEQMLNILAQEENEV